jgi:hypothetical protein
MEYIVPGLCGLAIILGLVAIVMSRSTWRIPQLILMFFLMAAALVFFYFSARVLKLRKNYQDEIKAYQNQLDLVKNGVPNGRKGTSQLEVERNDLRREVAKALAERGRVWDDAGRAKPANIDGTIYASFENPAVGIEPKMVLFVFDKSKKEEGGQYLGEFVVTKVGPEAKDVELKPVASLVQRELNAIGTSKGPWTLFEIMPMDNHTLFAEYDPNNLSTLLKWGPVPTDEPQKAEYDKSVARVLSQYKHDNKAADKDDPPDTIWVKVVLLKPWKADEPAAAAPAKDNAAGGNPAPAADVAKAAQNQQFQSPEPIYLPEDVATKLVADGLAKLDNSDPATSRIYQRPLRDYARLFRDAYVVRNRLFTRSADLAAQTALVEDAKTKITEDVEDAKKMRTGLKADLAKFKDELVVATSFSDAIQAKYEATRAELSQLFRGNLQLAAQLATVQQQLTDAIRRRAPAPEASAAVAPR